MGNRISQADIKISLESFVRDLQELSEQVQGLVNDFRENDVDLHDLKGELRTLTENVRHLMTVLSGGVDGRNLLTRVTVLEGRLESLERERDQRVTEQRIQNSSIANIQNQEVSGKWGLKIAMASGAVSLLVSLIHAIVQLFKK